MNSTRFHEVDGRRIAFRHRAGSGPALAFLPGYRGVMSGEKASAVHAWAHEQGRECLLLDYSGGGESDGEFAEGTLSRWRDEVIALIESHVASPGVVLIGSSMGGWLMLLVGAALGDRLRGLVGIAAAPDFTDWGRSDEDKVRLARGETVYDANPFGPERTPVHPRFWADGQENRRLGAPIALDCPVRLIHGMRDPVVPWNVSIRLAEALRSSEVHVTLVKDGGHNLSRAPDIALLLAALDTI